MDVLSCIRCIVNNMYCCYLLYVIASIPLRHLSICLFVGLFFGRFFKPDAFKLIVYPISSDVV